MTIEEENKEALGTWEHICASDRVKAVFAFATKNAHIEERKVSDSDGKPHAAAMYALQMYCQTLQLHPKNELAESVQIVALMTAIEESGYSAWHHFGAELLYDMRADGISITRDEVSAFLALEGDWSYPAKGQLMYGSPLAVCLYSSRLLTKYFTLNNMYPYMKNKDPLPLPKMEADPCAAIETLAMATIPAYIGEDDVKKLMRFLNWLRTGDFYTFENGALAKHTVQVICNLVNLTKPQNEKDLGEVVLAGLCHDICSINVDRDPSGNTVYDPLPFGCGRKSLYIASGYFGKNLGKTVAAAIDAYQHDIAAESYMPQAYLTPLALYLHLADVMATYLPNSENTGSAS